MNPITKYLEGPNFIPLQQYDDGTVGPMEVGNISDIAGCLEHVETATGFLMIEGGKVVDVSAFIAECWWRENRDDCDNCFDVPTLVHAYMHNEVYDDIAARKYNVRCQRDHERGAAS